MKEKAGRVFSIAQENAPVAGCTISKAIQGGEYEISYFSMARDTDISAESYGSSKLWIVSEGELEAYVKAPEETRATDIGPGDMYVTPVYDPVGLSAKTNAVYTEITLKGDSGMNGIIKAGSAFALKDLVPYQEGKIVNMDIVRDDNLKFVVMAFDSGTGLSEHAAPGEALIFALDGEAIIGYEGKEYLIKAGENFKFDKMGKHSVKAEKRFKMALLLHIEN